MVSITRPSRGDRWSATTTLQIGFFLPPTRVSRTRTAIGRWRLADLAARQLLHAGHLPLLQLLHDLLHLAELLDQLVDGLHRGPGAARDPPAARAVDDRRVRALLGRHRGDDRLEAVDLPFVDVQRAELLADPGEHLQDPPERAHPAQLLELSQEVVEGHLPLADLPLELGSFVLVELLLSLLRKSQDIAHPEDPLRHAVRVEAL